ncbi:MAG: hypothetical protein ACRDMV_18195 [Streptosporangiales bacterium]
MSSRSGLRSGKAKFVFVLVALAAVALLLVIYAPTQTADFITHAKTSVGTFSNQLQK